MNDANLYYGDFLKNLFKIFNSENPVNKKIKNIDIIDKFEIICSFENYYGVGKYRIYVIPIIKESGLIFPKMYLTIDGHNKGGNDIFFIANSIVAKQVAICLKQSIEVLLDKEAEIYHASTFTKHIDTFQYKLQNQNNINIDLMREVRSAISGNDANKTEYKLQLQ